MENGERIICQVCGQEQGSIRGLSQHLRHTHAMKPQEYFDRYLRRSETEGICPVCGKPTPFDSIRKGYKTFCGRRCSNKSDEKRAVQRQHAAEKTAEDWAAIYEKQKQTRREHFGDEHYGLYGSDAFHQLMEERYGDIYFRFPHDPQKGTQVRQLHEMLPKLEEHGISVQPDEKFDIMSCRCAACGHEFQMQLGELLSQDVGQGVCPHCHPRRQ